MTSRDAITKAVAEAARSGPAKEVCADCGCELECVKHGCAKKYAAARDDALEEAAQLADKHPFGLTDLSRQIRALKGNAAPQLPSETAKVPTGPAAESAPRCVGVPSPLFDEVLDFLEQYEDMRDGPDGQPQPNSAMRLLSELREAERPSEK